MSRGPRRQIFHTRDIPTLPFGPQFTAPAFISARLAVAEYSAKALIAAHTNCTVHPISDTQVAELRQAFGL